MQFVGTVDDVVTRAKERSQQSNLKIAKTASEASSLVPITSYHSYVAIFGSHLALKA